MTNQDIIKLINGFHLFYRPEEFYNGHFAYLDEILKKFSKEEITHAARPIIAQKIIEDAILKDENPQDYINTILTKGNGNYRYIHLIDFVFAHKPELINISSEFFQDALTSFASKEVAANFLNERYSAEEISSHPGLIDDLLNRSLKFNNTYYLSAYKEVFIKLKDRNQEFAEQVNKFIQDNCHRKLTIKEVILEVDEVKRLGEVFKNDYCIKSSLSELTDLLG